MTAEEKALAACVDYAKAKADIKRLSDEIGRHLGACHDAHVEQYKDSRFPPAYRSHLEEAYAFEVNEDAYGGVRDYLSEAEQTEVLSACPHCKAAHDAIQARKEAKKRFGIAKRRITLIGRSA